MTDPTYEIQVSPVAIPVPCGPTTVADYTIVQFEQAWGTDTFCVVTRSCSHWYYRAWRIPWVLPVVGEVAMTCLGPQPETLPSGRADPSAAPLKKGKRWTRLKDKVA